MTTMTKPKDRILKAAIHLFAQKGFDGVGVRELADTAHVNLSMINYYFGSKAGILKAIIDAFFTKYIANARAAFKTNHPLEEKIRIMIRTEIDFFKANPEMMRIALTELPFNMPDVVAQKSDHVQYMRDYIAPLVAPMLDETQIGQVPLEIVGPALLGMMSLHFILRPIVRNLKDIILDESFYERYTHIVTHIFLYGVVSLASDAQSSKGPAPHNA